MQNAIKILICYYRSEQLSFIQSNKLPSFFIPVHAGKSLTKEPNKNTKNLLADNMGDNISMKNPYLGEFTVLYWAWKNLAKIGNPDYIGFCHYRAFLNFASRGVKYPPLLYLPHQKMNALFQLNDLAKLQKLLNKYHALIPSSWKLPIKSIYEPKLKTVYQHYCFFHYQKDFDLMLKIIASKYPQLVKYSNKYLINDSRPHLLNIFVLKQELFIKYCEFVFSILFELEKQIDTSLYNAYQKRVLAFLGERLASFYFKLIKKGLVDEI